MTSWRTTSEVQADLDAVDTRMHNLATEGRALAAATKKAGRWTAGQRQAVEESKRGFEKALEEQTALRAEMQELREQDQRREYIRSQAMDPANLEHTDDISREMANRAAPSLNPYTATRSQFESAALRAVERHLLAPSAQDRLDTVIRDTETDPGALGARYIAAVSDPAYERAFSLILRQPMTAHLSMTPEELEAVRTVRQVDSLRAMSLAGSGGGFAVPFALDPTLLGTSNGTAAYFRRVATVKTIAVDEWRGVTSGAITAAYAAEATATTDNSPTLAQPTISTEKAQAFIPFSIEIGMDWPTLQEELGALLAESKDDLEAAKFTAGSGTNEPFGILTGATNTVNATTGQTVDAEDIYRLEQALPARYQARASYMASGTIINTLYRLVGGGSTEPPLVNEDRTRLLGKPLVFNSEMGTTTATGVKFLLYGDFSRFVIVDRIGLQIELIPHLFDTTNNRPTGQRGLYMYFRNSSKLIDANAVRALIGIA